MKKIKIVLLSVLGVVIIVGLLALNMGSWVDCFWEKIDARMDYERSLEVGDDFNKLVWGEMFFQINHHKDGNNLEYVNNGGKEIDVLLEGISSYKILDGQLYVKSKDGCAIISKNDFCRIFTYTPTDGTTSEYTVNSYGYKVYKGRKMNQENVEYLLNYESFTEAERKVLKRM